MVYINETHGETPTYADRCRVAEAAQQYFGSRVTVLVDDGSVQSLYRVYFHTAYLIEGGKIQKVDATTGVLGLLESR